MSGSTWFLLFALALFAYTFYRKMPQGWVVRWSQGTPKRPTIRGNGWYIDVPQAGVGHLNDVLFAVLFNKKKSFLEGVKSITLRGHITGGGFLTCEGFDPATNPANASLMLQRRGDKRSEDPKFMNYRWYSKETIPLVAGDFEMTVPLDVEHMGSVLGGHDPAAFQDVLDNLLGFAVVFGSDGGRAHGVYASQPAGFALTSYSLNR